MKRWIFIISAVLLAAVAVVWWRGSAAKSKQTAVYRLGVVDRGTVKTVVSATGTASAVTTVSVGSQVSGTIIEILVDFNSPVKKGQIVARIDPKFLEAAVTEAQATIEKARATLSQARRDSTRIADLFAQKMAAQADNDNALTAVEQALAGVQQAQAQLWRAQTNLAYSVITSPIDGVVISRNVDVGQTVAASMSTPELFSIAQDLHKMQIETHIDEADIGGLRDGMKADFTVDSYPDEHFHGTIRQVRYAATVDQNVVTYPVIIDVDNPDLKLMPGMTANVTIVTAQRDDALRVPASALRFKPTTSATNGKSTASSATTKSTATTSSRRSSGGGSGTPLPSAASGAGSPMKSDSATGTSGVIYIKSANGEPEARPVRVGLNDGTNAEILSGGIAPGDSVIMGLTGKTSSTSSSSSSRTAPGMGMGGPH
jgi:HlyD family secretion protein